MLLTELFEALEHSAFDNTRYPYEPKRGEWAWRGPHNGKEIDLLAKGKKPVGLFDRSEINELLPVIKSAGLRLMPMLQFEEIPGGPRIPGILVYQPGEEKRARMIARLFDEYADKKTDQRFHTAIGNALGYSDEDIKQFLDHWHS